MSTSTAKNSSMRILPVALATASLLLAGCGADESASRTTESATTASEAADPGASASAEASAEHNEADTKFAQMMLPHHRQAVQMSEVLLAKAGVDERVVTLASEIEAAQQPEIDQMIGLLEAWGEDVPEDAMGMGDTSMDGMGSGDDEEMHGEMGGMMSADDMKQLEDAQGVDAARLFLEQMTRHHEGAVAMARTQLEAGQNPQALELAQAIVDSQEAEIGQMQEILTTL